MKKRVYISGLFLAFSGISYGAEESKPAQGPQEESTTSTTSQSVTPVPNFDIPHPQYAESNLTPGQVQLNEIYERNGLELKAARKAVRERARERAREERAQEEIDQDVSDINGQPKKKKVRLLNFADDASEYKNFFFKNDRDDQGGPAGGCAL